MRVFRSAAASAGFDLPWLRGGPSRMAQGRLPLPAGIDPRRERLQKPPQEAASALVGQFSLSVEQIGRLADAGFRLLHRRRVQEHQRVAQVMVRADCAERSGQGADHRTRLAARALDKRGASFRTGRQGLGG
jgi:hypothetical protein